MKYLDFFKNLFKKETKEEPKKLKTGIVFSGGGVRGFSYIGVMRALKEAGIEFDMVAGTSIGSLMGALYALDMPIEEMEQYALKVKQSDFTSSKIMFVPSKTERFEKMLDEILQDNTFETLKKPLCVVAVDLKTGKEVHITSGNLKKAIAGSCAVPGVFTPVELDDKILVDGLLTNNIPADALREMGADIVVSLDINPTRGYGTDSTKTIDVLKASLRILMVSNAVNGYVHSDYIIKIDLSEFSQLKISNTLELMKRGYVATKKVIPDLQQVLNRKTANQNIKKMTKKLRAIKRKSEELERLTNNLSDKEKLEYEKFVKKHK